MQSVDEALRGTLRLAVLNTLLAELLLRESTSVRVELKHDLLVAERVLLLSDRALSAGFTLWCVHNRLDFRRVNQTGNVCVGNLARRQEEVLLESGGGSGGSVELIEGLEGGGRPDDEATKVATRGEEEEVESVHGDRLNTRDVAECADKLLAVDLRVVDNKRTTALAETAVPHLTLTSAHLLRLLHLDELFASTKGLEELDSSLGLGESTSLEGLRVNDQRDLRNVTDTVTTGEKEGGNGGSSQSGSSSEAPKRL